MADFYADSSVLVKRHVSETGTTWFRGIAHRVSGNVILTTRLSIVEVYSALNRRVREGPSIPPRMPRSPPISTASARPSIG